MQITKTAMSRAVLAAALIGGLASGSASANFSGAYDPGNWTINNGPGGSVDTTGAPASITITGGNLCGNSFTCVIPGSTSFTIGLNSPTEFKFHWVYHTDDADGPSFDPFRVLVDGIPTQLSNDNGPDNQSGDYQVWASNSFGWDIFTDDGEFGAANVTISNFRVPEPASLALLGLGLAGLGYSRRKLPV